MKGRCWILSSRYVVKICCEYALSCYFRTPRHSVSSVLVAHNLAVASSLPVTSIEPSSCGFSHLKSCIKWDGAYREAHAVDALLMVGHRLQQLSLLPPGAPPRPHLSTGLDLHSCTTTWSNEKNCYRYAIYFPTLASCAGLNQQWWMFWSSWAMLGHCVPVCWVTFLVEPQISTCKIDMHSKFLFHT